MRVGETKIKYNSRATRAIIKHAYREGVETQGRLNADNIDALLKVSIDKIAETERPRNLNTKNEKRRTGIGVEILLTASPEYMKKLTQEEQRNYLMHGAIFFTTKYAKAGYSALGYTIHFDEQTPHAHLFLINNKTLNCRNDFGNPDLLSKLQDDYYNHMQKEVELKHHRTNPERLTKPRRHISIQDYNKKVDYLKSLTPEELKFLIKGILGKIKNNDYTDKAEEKNLKLTIDLIKQEKIVKDEDFPTIDF